MISIDYVNHPKKTLTELLRRYNHTTVLTLDVILSNEEMYSVVFQDMLDILKYGIEYKVIREWPIHFIIHEGDSKAWDDVHTLQVRHFLSNLCVWYAYMKMENIRVMDDTFVVDWTDKNANFIADFIDEKILPYQDTQDFHSMNAIVDEILYQIKAVSDAFCLIFGYSASIWDIMKAEESNPEIHHLIYDEIPANLQPKELEDLLAAKNKRLIELFSKADSDLRPLLMSGKNISPNQFKEIFLRIGFKADLSNRTIPWYLDANLLRTGIWMPSYFLIGAMSGRKAQIESKLSMSKPGALSKKMNHNSTAVVLRQDHEICDSARPITYEIKDDRFLEMLDKRNYYDDKGEMHMLNYKRDKHLIGKKIRFRSPCTCTSKEGVCEACYGGLYNINKDLFSQGSLAATKVTEPTSQLVLGQKHSQFTQSDEIAFDDLFYQCFDIVSSEVTLSEDVDLDSGLLLDLGPVEVEETDDGEAYRIEYFDIINYNGEILGRVKEQHDFPLYLANEMISAWKASAGHPIPLSRFNDVDDDVILFNIEVKSKAVTQSLQLITAALDSKDHLGNAHNIDGLCQRFGEIMLDCNIAYPFVHNELIIRAMMRKIGNEFEYPDFSANGDHDDYEIMRLTWSLRKNPSPIIRLCTGWLKASLTSTSLYKSTKPSHFDALFIPKLQDVIDQ